MIERKGIEMKKSNTKKETKADKKPDDMTIDEIIFYDENLKKEVRYYIENDSWIDEDGNLTSLDEIEYQLNNYAKKGTIKLSVG